MKKREHVKNSNKSLNSSKKTGKNSEINESKIRERAYQIYKERMPNEGDELQDWLKAMKELGATGK